MMTTGLVQLDYYWKSKSHCPVCAKKRGWGEGDLVLVSDSFGSPPIFKLTYSPGIVILISTRVR